MPTSATNTPASTGPTPGTARFDTRHARYRGLAKTRLEHVYKAVALNLIRLDAWWNGNPIDRRRTSHLSRLELALAA
jgi:hypothetical protein